MSSIGVDTHVRTHSAAVVDAATGGVLGELPAGVTAEGYAELWNSPANTSRCGPGRSKGPEVMVPVA